MHRRADVRLFVVIFLFGLMAAATGAGSAQGFPSKPVRLVLGFAPGGTVDLQARLLAQKLAVGSTPAQLAAHIKKRIAEVGASHQRIRRPYRLKRFRGENPLKNLPRIRLRMFDEY